MNMGNKTAMYILGLAYANGKMDNFDENNSKHVYEMTIKYLAPFAEEGKIAAIVDLGMTYLYGYNENRYFDKFEFSIPNPVVVSQVYVFADGGFPGATAQGK